MRYKVLGKTGLFVSELCLGTMTFGTHSGRFASATGVGQEEADAIVRRAFDEGINFIDTANVYTGGQSEEITGRALKNLGIARQDVVISTKVEGAMGKGPNDSGASRYHIMEQVKASLKRLGTEHIDLYQIHAWDSATSLEEVVRALDDLVRQGLVRYVGVSNWAAWQVVQALGVAERLNATRLHSVQSYYSLVGRELEREIVPMLEAQGLGLMVWSPLASGYLSGKYRDGKSGGRRTSIDFPPINEERGEVVLDALDGIAVTHGVSMAAISIAWLLHQRPVTSVILGAKRLEQLEDNLKATEVRLSESELKTLDEASAIVPEYPGWMAQMHNVERRVLFESGELPR
ncbi:aldo/keto reductase [bacterium]|nr:MAG: aldo/keto reductase [bacterium]